MKKTLPSIAFLLLLLLISPRTDAVVINDVDFTVAWYGSEAPTTPTADTPAWTAGGSLATSGTANSPSAGIYTLTVTESGFATARLDLDSTHWNGSSPTTVEFKMKVNSQDPASSRGAANFSIINGTRQFLVYLGETDIRALVTVSEAIEYEMDTMSDFNTYRITLDSGLMNIYVNNDPTAVISGYEGFAGNSNNAISWGDTGSTVGGTTEWQYVAFTNDGAFAPVPEPAAAAGLLGAVALCALVFRRRLAR